MPTTWLLTGIPRSGTSLSCRLAAGLPDTVALSEPLNGKPYWKRARDPHNACTFIGEFVERARERILAESRAPSMLVHGRLDDGMVAAEPGSDGLRAPQSQWGEYPVDKALSIRFTLVVKHNALFTALLPRLTESLPCLALVRNPVSVLASWQTVNLPVHRGRIPEGEALDGRLRGALNREPDALRRQLMLLEWFFARFRSHLPAGNVMRYEDVVDTGGVALFRRLGHAGAAPVDLKSRNSNPLYDRVPVETLLRVLLDAGGSWMHYYTPGDCEQVAHRIRHGR